MAAYDMIVIIYNPNSTGDAASMAKRLMGRLAKKKIKAKLYPTDHAGHGGEIAQRVAQKHKHPLIISVSGDGGYHDIINGIMRTDNRHAVAAVYGAGNANDHYEATRGIGLATAIIKGEPPTPVDILEVEIDGPSPHIEFAHSYAGIGISAQIGRALNKTSLNRWRELSILYRGIIAHRPTSIILDGRAVRVDSLICANINRMAKVLSFAQDPTLQDGTFELHTLKHQGLWAILIEFARLAFGRSHRISSVSHVTFQTRHDTPLQMDGEILNLPSGADVTIRSRAQSLLTLI